MAIGDEQLVSRVHGLRSDETEQRDAERDGAAVAARRARRVVLEQRLRSFHIRARRERRAVVQTVADPAGDVALGRVRVELERLGTPRIRMGEGLPIGHLAVGPLFGGGRRRCKVFLVGGV